MEYLYFPGCTLKDKYALKMEKTTLQAAEYLGINLREIKEWQCCGAVYPLAQDEYVTLISPARTLFNAKETPVVSLCSACHHVLKRTSERMEADKEARDKISQYLEESYPGKNRVLHFLEVLRDDLGWEELKRKIENPLSGRRMAAYYGCMLLRPASEMNFDHPERPRIMEDFLQTLGAEVITYPFRNKCCGAYLSLTEKEVMTNTSQNVIKMALKAGAEELVTACPLCHYNLSQTSEVQEGKIKIAYFSEPLAEALNLAAQEVVQ